MVRKLFGTFAMAVALCVGVVMADEIKGKITKIDPEKNLITVTVDGKDTEYTVAEDVKIPDRKDRKSGEMKKVALKDLAKRVGDGKTIDAKVVTEKKGDKEVVTEITPAAGKGKGKPDPNK